MDTVLLLDWKEEPVSPPSYEETAWFTEDSFYQTALKLETELGATSPHSSDDSKCDIPSHILDDIENFVDLDQLIKDEPFLLDEKMLPIMDEVEPPRATAVPVDPIKVEIKKQPDTESLLKEFENVYDVVLYSALTPPQSPPCQKPVLTTLEPLHARPIYTILPDKQQPVLYTVPDKQIMPNVISYRPAVANVAPMEFPTVNTPQPDIAHELAVVDELVRTRVEDMQWSSGSSGRSSPCSSRSSYGDYSGDFSDDPEWMPEHAGDSVDNNDISLKKTSRKRSKPYSRGLPEDKKSRKKEQNKNAATRYRMKKKAEVEVILTEEKQLLNHRDELDGKISELQREIKCLKGLMRDLFKAKGLIN